MPLTKASKDGIPYERPSDIDAEIVKVLATEPSTWSPEQLKSETLVHLIRWLWARNDVTNLGRLLKCLGRRVARIAKDFTSGLNSSQAYEFVLEIAQEMNLLIFAHPPSRKSEFLEIAFRRSVRQRAINHRSRLREARKREVSDSTLHTTDPSEGGTSFIESHEDDAKHSEELVVAAEEKRMAPEWIRRGLAAVSNPLHREAVVLHHLEGWPIASQDREVPTLSTRFGKSGRQIQNWIDRAVEEMRAALGDIS